jgi:hypothetical protein
VRISRQSLGVAGAVVLALSVFAPIVRAPVVGTLNYFSHGNGEGAVVLILAAAAVGLTLLGKHRLILLPAGVSLGMIAYTYLDIRAQLRDVKAALEGLGPLGPLGGLGTLALDAVQMQWGWAAMLCGVVLLFVAALMPEGEGQASAGPGASASSEEPPGTSANG